jgi:adenylyltransferase/sulfurtransferase
MKVDVAATRLLAINPHIQVERISEFADANLLENLIPEFDVVIDATDNFSAKYTINDACEKSRIPLVYGSIFQFEGQVSVFHLKSGEHPAGFSYRDLYPSMPPAGISQNCGEAGVIGVLPGIIGSLQANEAIKIITGLGEPLSGTLLTFDALSAQTRKLMIGKRNKRDFLETADLDIDFDNLLERMKSTNPPKLIDVRDLDEQHPVMLGGDRIPLLTLPNHVPTLPIDRVIVLYCKSGVRSARAGLYLRSVLPNVKILSLRGGLDAGMDLACPI